jgi:hypothetical protein
MNFRFWLEQDHNYDSDQDQLEHKMFEFVFDKVEKAAKVAEDESTKFYDAMAKVWPENTRGRDFFLPKAQFPNHSQIRFRIDQGSNESSTEKVNGEIDTISIGAKDLQESLLRRDKASVQQHLDRISGSLNHEMTHLHHKGADEGDGGVEDAIRYMTTQGEMRAHAKDYAWTWSRSFPGRPFDPKKFMEVIVPKLVDSKQKKARNYFVAFADPLKQEKYKHVADLGAANKQLIGMVNGYVNYYIKKNPLQQDQAKENPLGLKVGSTEDMRRLSNQPQNQQNIKWQRTPGFNQ